MTKAITTIGLQYGHENKQITTNHLVTTHNIKQSIRYSGGPNTPDSNYKQLTAATHQECQTIIWHATTINPITLAQEIQTTKPKHPVIIHPNCLIHTIAHQLTYTHPNTYQTQHGQDAITAQDLNHHNTLRQKLELLINRQNLTNLSTSKIIHQLQKTTQHYQTTNKITLTNTILLEGYLGILQDKTHGPHPHTTHYNLTTKHAKEFLTEHNIKNNTTYGIANTTTKNKNHRPHPTHTHTQNNHTIGHLDLPLLTYATKITNPDQILLINQNPNTPTKIATQYTQHMWPLSYKNNHNNQQIDPNQINTRQIQTLFSDILTRIQNTQKHSITYQTTNNPQQTITQTTNKPTQTIT